MEIAAHHVNISHAVDIRESFTSLHTIIDSMWKKVNYRLSSVAGAVEVLVHKSLVNQSPQLPMLVHDQNDYV